MVTGQQVRRLRQKLMQGKTQEAAAAAAGMSVRSAGKWQRGLLPAERKSPRTWRTRPDPFTGIWNDVIEPLLRRDPESALQATTVLEWLEERYPGRFSPAQLRTLQRRLRDWRALHGRLGAHRGQLEGRAELAYPIGVGVAAATMWVLFVTIGACPIGLRP